MNTLARIALRIGPILCIVALVTSLGYGQASTSAACSFRFLDVLGPSGINDAGAIVGGTFGRHVTETAAFLIYRDKVTFFRYPPDSLNSFASDINNFSQIVGSGFVVRNGAFQAIRFPGATTTFAAGINSFGTIVGSYVNQAGQSRAFLLYRGRFTSFSFPHAQSTSASRINDHSVIVGSYNDGSHSHGFQVKNGAFATIDFPGAIDTNVSDVDNAGNMVGVYTLNNISHGFVRRNTGKFITIDAPGAQGLNAGTLIGGMNNLSQIVGYYTFGDDPTAIQAQPFQADCKGVF